VSTASSSSKRHGSGWPVPSLEASFQSDPSTLEDDHIDLEWLIWPTVPGGIGCVSLQSRSLLGYLRVSHPWFEVSKPTRQLIRDLALWVVASLAWVRGIGNSWKLVLQRLPKLE
jgi:OmpR-family two-component system manganese-sensing sensor histidine kinase